MNPSCIEHPALILYAISKSVEMQTQNSQNDITKIDKKKERGNAKKKKKFKARALAIHYEIPWPCCGLPAEPPLRAGYIMRRGHGAGAQFLKAQNVRKGRLQPADHHQWVGGNWKQQYNALQRRAVTHKKNLSKSKVSVDRPHSSETCGLLLANV